MYETFLYAHWNIYEMYNFSMQWQLDILIDIFPTRYIN
jgi:hypothetical protein